MLSRIKWLHNELSTGVMDFRGQDLAYLIQLSVSIISAVVGFTVGFIKQRFLYTFLIIAIPCAVAFIVTFFSWPCYRRHPILYKPPPTKAESELTKKMAS